MIFTLLLGGDLTADAGDVTVDARPATGTLAGERRPLLPTRATVLTGRGVTPAHQTLKHQISVDKACEIDLYHENILLYTIYISVFMYLAVESGVSVWAGAFVGAVSVLTGASVLARPRVALVNVMLAVIPGKSRQTHA